MITRYLRCQLQPGRDWWGTSRGCSRTRLRVLVALHKTIILCSGTQLYLGRFIFVITIEQAELLDAYVCLNISLYVNFYTVGHDILRFLFACGLQSRWYTLGWRWVSLVLVLSYTNLHFIHVCDSGQLQHEVLWFECHRYVQIDSSGIRRVSKQATNCSLCFSDVPSK